MKVEVHEGIGIVEVRVDYIICISYEIIDGLQKWKIKKGENLLINYYSYKHAELIANGINRWESWDNVFINYE